MKAITCLLLIAVLVTGCSDNRDSGLDNQPEFTNTSQDAIKAEYRLKKGKPYPFQSSIDARAVIDAGTRRLAMENRLISQGYYQVSAIQPNRYELLYHIKRVRQTIRFNDRTIKLDTNKHVYRNTEFHRLVQSPIRVIITPHGRIISVQHKLLGGIYQQSMGPVLRELVRNTFIPLPHQPIRTGDSYVGEKITYKDPAPGLKMSVKTRYHVAAISADKKKMLLVINGDAQIQSMRDSLKIDPGTRKYKGWILFDLDKGILEKSAMRIHLTMEVKRRNRTANMRVTNYGEYHAR